MRRTDFRWGIKRTDGYARKRGIGTWYVRGTTGTTYGQLGTDEHFCVTVLIGTLEFVLRADWKSHAR